MMIGAGRITWLSLLILSGVPMAAAAEGPGDPELARPSGATIVGEPSIPTVTIAVKDAPDWVHDANAFGLEMKRREDFGFIPATYAVKPQLDPLLDPSPPRASRLLTTFGVPLYNFAGQTSSSSPPDANGDVGPNHYVQAVNQATSTVRILSKTTGADLKTFTMQSLTSVPPCSSGYCDSVVLYDRAADRWLITELPRTGGSVCMYVSTSPDPTGTWYAYSFLVETGLADFPKYGIWPQRSNRGSYLMGVNAGTSSVRDVFAFDRAKMLAGLPATFQKFSVPRLPNSGFQLVLPSSVQGSMLPPEGEPALFIRPRDDEAQSGASTPAADFLEIWQLSVDWATPENSVLSQRPSLPIADYDMTLCGMGNDWNCMPQPGTSQKLDPVREPLHFPLRYRNFGTYQSIVGTFVVDADGTDHAALRWFELRKSGNGSWSLFQQGLVGGEAGVHRALGSIGMDRSGNIALGYTRTGTTAPYYPSIYYRGRLASDPAGTMPQGEYPVIDATSPKNGNERWGDYASMTVDPSDDCTFWFTSQYGGAGATRVAAFKFDSCECVDVPGAPRVTTSTPRGNRVTVAWNDSPSASALQYLVSRSTTPGGPYTLLAEIADTSPGAGGGTGYSYDDDEVSGGTRYYYQVKASDGGSCVSGASNEADALATGQCLLAPTFGGAAAIDNPGNATCTLTVSWNPAASNCGSGISYNVYRSTDSGFTPDASNRIATGVRSLSYFDSFGVGCGTAYYYVVRAVDDANGSEESNVVHRPGVSTGPLTVTSWSETFEGSSGGGGFDGTGWSKTPIIGTTSWVWSSSQFRDGARSWFAADVASTSDKILVSPPFGVGPATQLSFWHTYRFEGTTSTCYDAGTLEYSTDAGASWQVVPAALFAAGGYTGTANPAFSNPIGGKPAWCGGTIAPMSAVVVNLGAQADMVGRTVQVRWHEGDDSGVGATGWYVDSVSVLNAQTGDLCTAGTGFLTVASPSSVCTGAALPLSATFSESGVTFSWTGPEGFASSSDHPVIASASAVNSGTYSVIVNAGTATLANGSTIVNVLSEGAACAAGDGCTGASTCANGSCVGGLPVTPPAGPQNISVNVSTLAWPEVAKAVAYDVLQGTLSGLRSDGLGSSATICANNDGPAANVPLPAPPAPGEGHWFLVRAVGTCGSASYDDESTSPAASRDTAIAAAPNACP